MDRYSIGLTNLVERPSTEASEIPSWEKRAAAPRLLAKIVRYRPGIVSFVGKGIYEEVRLPRASRDAILTHGSLSRRSRSTATCRGQRAWSRSGSNRS